MADIVQFSLQLVLGILLTWWVLRRDMQRLPPEQQERAWNDASFWVAVVVFNPICIPIHFTRTRRSLAGLALGIAWMAAVLAVLIGAAEAVGWLLGG